VAGVLWVWQVRLCDAVAESDGSGVVDESEAVETGDVGGVNEGATLDVCVPAWDSDDEICDARFELVGGDVV